MRSGFYRIPKKPKVFPDYGEGLCDYCGKLLVGRQKRWCCPRHGLKYMIEVADYEVISWYEVRREVLERDDYQCRDCCEKEDKHHFEVHHIVPIHKGGDEFDRENLITLCQKCHKKRHHKRGLEPTKNQTFLKFKGEN